MNMIVAWAIVLVVITFVLRGALHFGMYLARGDSRRAALPSPPVPDPATGLTVMSPGEWQRRWDVELGVTAAAPRPFLRQPLKERPPDHFGYTTDDLARPPSYEFDDPLLEEFEKLEQEIADREDAEKRAADLYEADVKRAEDMIEQSRLRAEREAEAEEIRATQEACEHANITMLATHVAMAVPPGSDLYSNGWRNVGATHQCLDCGQFHFKCMGMTWPVPPPGEVFEVGSA